MEGRWWAVKVEGYNSWTFAESEAEQARRNGYEVHGPFVRHDDAAIERVARALMRLQGHPTGPLVSDLNAPKFLLAAAGETP
jgi:hypothetical protein